MHVFANTKQLIIPSRMGMGYFNLPVYKVVDKNNNHAFIVGTGEDSVANTATCSGFDHPLSIEEFGMSAQEYINNK